MSKAHKLCNDVFKNTVCFESTLNAFKLLMSYLLPEVLCREKNRSNVSAAF